MGFSCRPWIYTCSFKSRLIPTPIGASKFQAKTPRVDICTPARTHKHRAHHQRSHYVVDSSSPCRQCYLPSVSEKGEMGNETDVCRGAFWVICLIQGLMGSEGIKRLKQRFSFLPPSPTLHLFPSPPLPENMSRSRGCLLLIFFLSGFNLGLVPRLDCVATVYVPIQSVEQRRAFRAHLPTYDLLLPY